MMLAIALATLWMLLSGHLEPLLLGFGVLSVVFVVWLSNRMNIVDRESYPFAVLPQLIAYWPWLLKEIVKANLDVAKRVFGPASAVKPVVFDAPASQRSEFGLVVYANSITLTPGTISLSVMPGKISVHAVHPDVAKGLIDSGMDARVPGVRVLP